MTASHHHMVHHHLRHRSVHVAPKPVLTFDHGDAASLTFRTPDGWLVTTGYAEAAQLCRLNVCKGA